MPCRSNRNRACGGQVSRAETTKSPASPKRDRAYPIGQVQVHVTGWIVIGMSAKGSGTGLSAWA